MCAPNLTQWYATVSVAEENKHFFSEVDEKLKFYSNFWLFIERVH